MSIAQIGDLTEWQVSELIIGYQVRKSADEKRTRDGKAEGRTEPTVPKSEEEEIALLKALAGMFGG